MMADLCFMWGRGLEKENGLQTLEKKMILMNDPLLVLQI